MENLSPIAYEAATDNFEALVEAMGGNAERMDFEYTDADRLEAAVQEHETCIFLVLLGGGDVDLSKRANKLVVSEPRSDEEGYEYVHSFVIIKTEDEGVKCFQQFPGGMDSDKECFSVDSEFWEGLRRLTAHSRAGVVPKTFQNLFCGSTSPSVLPPHDSMIMKGIGF
ncbi:unnamed protein product [Symbiodinium natans]|uniref:Uncharacterized protein n=1 Tax=Symbiodinium natans TaxID=878477 RepID=A0A812PIX1_9DINO|nr:unnamed protein product [Symbiodinium natans]